MQGVVVTVGGTLVLVALGTVVLVALGTLVLVALGTAVLVALGTLVLVAHNLLVSHGLAVPLIRANVPDAQVGITLNLTPSYPLGNSESGKLAAAWHDRFFNTQFLDPIFGRPYPDGLWQSLGIATPQMEAGDAELIAVPIDFLGVNYYSRALVSHSGDPANPVKWEHNQGAVYTEMDWEVYPTGLYDLLLRLHREYQPAKMYITENGASFRDQPDARGYVHDEQRRALHRGTPAPV